MTRRSTHRNAIAVGLLRAYKLVVSPLLPPSCRFYPSCSEYAAQAFAARPFFAALWLTARRLAKCGPWHPGGFDPLPDEDHQKR